MHRALSANSEILVPPRLFDGIERITNMRVEGSFERRHEVTAFAHIGRVSASTLVAWPGDLVANRHATYRGPFFL
jgi:hypothetical protein